MTSHDHRPTLRPDRTPFVGRLDELARLRALYAEGARFVSLLGTAGVGKTRLAFQLAREEAAVDPAGVVCVELAEASTAADLAERILAALGVPNGGVQESGRLGDALHARGPILLVLDNCEYLLSEAHALLDRALEAAPLVRLLTTSQVPLGLDGELCFEVPPLSPADAVALYELQARRSDAAAPLDRAAIAELVDRLDRNALAIRLAAARVRTLRPRLLLDRIDHRLDLLRGGPPGRHESLQRAIGQAWELLEPWEADALMQCATFAGGFTLEAAEAVLDLAAFAEAPPIVEVIDRLRSRVLLGAGDEDPPRFSMQESIRLFALDALERTGRTEATWRRHAAYFLARAEPPPPWIATSALVRELVPDEENLRAAMRRTAGFDPSTAARLALVLEPLLARHGAGGSVRHFEAAVGWARSAGDPVLLGRALLALAVARVECSDLAEARMQAEAAFTIAEGSGSAHLVCAALIERAFVLVQSNAWDDAVPLLRQALADARALGAVALEGKAEMRLGTAMQAMGDADQAAGHVERAIPLFHQVGCARLEALALLELGTCRLNVGALEAAHLALDRARALTATLSDRVLESCILVHLGYVALTDGRLDEAERQLGEGRQIGRETGRQQFEAIATGNLAVVALERGRVREARDLIEEAIPTLRSFGRHRYLAAFECVHAAIIALDGEPERARTELDGARSLLVSEQDALHLALDIFDGFVDLARAREGGTTAAADLAAARARLGEGPAVAGGPGLIAARLLRSALERSPGAALQAPPALEGGLVVGMDALWFEVAGSPRVQLGTRKTIRRILAALVDRRLRAAGLGMSVEQVFAAGWPGESAHPHAAATRVYDAIRILRHAGLEALLLRQDDGYLLDPRRPVRWFVP